MRALQQPLSSAREEIRKRLEALSVSHLLESNIAYFLVGAVAAMEEILVRGGHADEIRSDGFLVVWDRYTPHPEGTRWFPPAGLRMTVDRAAPPKLGGLTPEIKSAIDYLIAGLRLNQEAVLNNRPEVEVLNGEGRVVSRTRRVKV